MCVTEKRLSVGVRKGSHGMVEIRLLCFRWLSPFFKNVQKRFQDLLKVGTSLFTLCGYIPSSVASLIRRSLYLVLAEVLCPVI